jgi:hypothetical protein
MALDLAEKLQPFQRRLELGAYASFFGRINLLQPDRLQVGGD